MWSFIKRHRKKFFIAGGIIGGLVVINKYFSRKVSEWEDRQAKNYIELRKRLHHFEGTLQTCDSTIISFLPKLKEIIHSLLDDEPILCKLKTNPSDKVMLWEELKVCIFTQAVCELYCECVLVIFVRIQLSVIGGYMYIDSQCKKSFDEPKCVATADVQHKYLSLVHNLYQEGVTHIANDVSEAVRSSIGNISLKERLRLKNFEDILLTVKNKMAPTISNHIIQLLSINNKQNIPLAATDETVFQRMVAETYDVFENDDFKNKVVTECVNRGYELLMDRLSECYMSMSQESVDFVNPYCLEVPLAKLLPVIHSTLRQHQTNKEYSFVKILLQMEILKSFSANVYETFSQEPKNDIDLNGINNIRYC